MVFKMKKTNYLIKIAVGILFFSTLLSCNNNSNQDDKLIKVSLRQEWFPFSGYAGEVVAMYETDSIYGLEIEVAAGADNIDPIKLVLSGTDQFGVASADRILTANEKGADIVVIGVINYKSPTCFLAMKEKGILTPKDFEGKTVGILTGTNTEYIYKALKNKTGIDQEKIKEVEIPFDLGTFISGSYDVRPAFIYDETVSLDLHGIDYTVIEPLDYDVHFLGTVYFTTRKIIEKNPELVQNFINAIADGWKIALDDPQKAISYLKKYDNEINENRELLSLKKGLPYFIGQDSLILNADIAEWTAMVSTLLDLGVIKSNDICGLIDNSFVQKYNSNN